MFRHYRNNVRAVILSIALFFGPSILAQTCTPGELRVLVVDSQDTPVFDAEVHVSQEPPSAADRSAKTTRTTDFEKLGCGTWLVTVSKEGFEPAAKTVEISSGSRSEVSLVLKLYSGIWRCAADFAA